MNRLLGLASAMAWAASRSKNRITYALPGWALYMLISWGAAAALLFPYQESLRNQTPLLTGVSELVERGVTRPYITVTGFPIYQPIATESTNGRDTRWFWPLRDEKEQIAINPHVICVVSNENPQTQLAQMVTLTGMMRAPESELRDILEQQATDMNILTTHVFHPGAKPLPPALLVAGMAALALLGLLLLLGSRNQFTVFRARPMPAAGPGTVPPPTAERPIRCLVTGKLPMAEGHARIFVRDAIADIVPGVDSLGNARGHFVITRAPSKGTMVNLQLPLINDIAARTGWVYDGGKTLPAVHATGDGVNVYLKCQSPDHAVAAQQAIAAA